MTTEKVLGKIDSVRFGHVGYQEAMLGISISFKLAGGSGIGGAGRYGWDPNIIECSKHCQWTEEDRDKQFAECMRYISDLLHDAQVHYVEQLKGIPVEVELDGNTFKDFRILTEVL